MDFEPITCGYGTMYAFRGNECEHFTEVNLTGLTRVSIDFRVIRREELGEHPVAEAGDLSKSTPQKEGASKYFTLGRYYQKTWGGPPDGEVSSSAT